ncbi:acetolactate decarboxylase [Undibacterium sp. SXout20W]|uniref:acetolactate decarboxylase n=1 Tax=Undibacterium sp. SXout20W TaxID=3413051 RepID=UPI003BF27C79
MKTAVKHISLVALFAMTMVPMAKADESRLYQYSTIDALLAGAYEGDITVSELAKHGNFGIGTYNRVDGEMILLDGVFFKVKGSGKVELANPQEHSPLAIVTDFKTDTRVDLSDAKTLAELEAKLDASLVNKNLFYAIRIEGEFDGMTTRAIYPQDKPYKPLAEVSKTQSVFKIGATKGQLIGFRSPAFVKGFNVPGYHWHFLSADHNSGGHVLALQLLTGHAQIATISAVELKVPTSDSFMNADQSKDRSQELHAVEKSRN